MKRPITLMLAALLLSLTVAPMVRANTYEIHYSGTIVSVLDVDGNPGGTFLLDHGLDVGDTYAGTLTFSTENAVQEESTEAPFRRASYDFGEAHPQLTFNAAPPLALKPKIGLTIVDNIAIPNGLPPEEPYFLAGMKAAGLEPATTDSVDLLMLYGDFADSDFGQGFGSEFILVTFDPTSTALTGTTLPDPQQLLSRSFFVYLETVDHVKRASAIGLPGTLTISAVPAPPALWLLGAGLVMLRRRATKRIR